MKKIKSVYMAIVITLLTIIAGILLAKAIPIEAEEPEQPGISKVKSAKAFPAAEATGEYIPNVQEQIIMKCREYGIPHDIPLAIAKLETGHFTSAAFIAYNNVGGMSINEVPIQYESLEHGVEAFVKNLAENYFSQGLDTAEKIGGKYCPANENWAAIVNQLME